MKHKTGSSAADSTTSDAIRDRLISALEAMSGQLNRHALAHRSAKMLLCLQVPFGGSFYNLVHWCAWNEGSSGKVRLQVSCDVVYTNKWVPAKSIITSSSTEVGTPLRNLHACRLFTYARCLAFSTVVDGQLASDCCVLLNAYLVVSY